jgi:aryl-alcohol dehydrogenase-like predicted oxidoreductase
MNPTLGSDGPALSRLGLGCMSMTGSYGATDPHEAAATVLEALDSGVIMFDTGDFYGDGANEELPGRTLADDGTTPCTRAARNDVRALR